MRFSVECLLRVCDRVIAARRTPGGKRGVGRTPPRTGFAARAVYGSPRNNLVENNEGGKPVLIWGFNLYQPDCQASISVIVSILSACVNTPRIRPLTTTRRRIRKTSRLSSGSRTDASYERHQARFTREPFCDELGGVVRIVKPFQT